MLKDYGTADNDMMDRFPQAREARERQTTKEELDVAKFYERLDGE